MMRRAPRIALTADERAELERWVAAPGAPERSVRRARIVLDAADGGTNGQIARSIGVHPDTVALWRGRFLAGRLEAIRHEAPRPGSGRRAPPGLIDRIIRMTLEVQPPSGQWTTRSLAHTLQVNHMMVYRVWKAHGLAPPVARALVRAPTLNRSRRRVE
jgi:transposase